jgi:hypothetical protein
MTPSGKSRYVCSLGVRPPQRSAQFYAADEDAAAKFVVETDNPDVPRVIEQGFRPKQAERIPAGLLAPVIEFTRTRAVVFQRLPRNSTPGLRRAHRLASRQLWQSRHRGSG